MEKKKILMVDDEPMFCKMVKKNLESMGNYQVETVTEAAKAHAAAKSFRPDLILMDVIMPDMRGSSVALQIKADDELKHVPIVFMTALAVKGTEELFLGMVDGRPFYAKPVLPKPVNPEELDKQIRASLDK
ncbi:MAG TPA: response regulator [Verrucomicrobiae bacterium]|jgi:CheY-like chemotaxis protein|nr:response regulator [Verrucomicrobiae bacterium]